MNLNAYIQKLFKGDDIFYITTDVKRALGLENILPRFHVITSSFDPIIPLLRKNNVQVFCLEEMQKGNILPKSSGSILGHLKVHEYIARNSKNPRILTFKPSLSVDTLCQENSQYTYLGNSRILNEEFEDKIKFHSILTKNFPDQLIPSLIGEFGTLDYQTIIRGIGNFLVVQFKKGWAGNTTFFIRDKSQFEELKSKFSQTMVRISKYINGSTFLNNCCIYHKKVLQSTPAIQISGISWLNSNPSSTAGREWGNSFLSKKKKEEISSITQKLGEILIESGFKGYFGIDFIADNDNEHIYVSELNSRFTASTPFYTKLELGQGILPLYIYHLAEFLNYDIAQNYEGFEKIQGAEINLTGHKIHTFKNGTYKMENNGTLVYQGDSYNPAHLVKNSQIVILSDLHKGKIQTNYTVLLRRFVFEDSFEHVLKGILV